jgi:hypothetical protein
MSGQIVGDSSDDVHIDKLKSGGALQVLQKPGFESGPKFVLVISKLCKTF